MLKQADNETVAEVLRIRHAIDPVTAVHEFDPDEAHPWVALLRGFAHQDVIDAVWAHYSRESRAVWPADVIARMETLAVERQDRVLAAKESAQEGQTDWSVQDKAAWSVAWDSAVGRGEPARKAKDEADETHPEPKKEPDSEPEDEPQTENEQAADQDDQDREPEEGRESGDGDADADSDENGSSSSGD